MEELVRIVNMCVVAAAYVGFGDYVTSFMFHYMEKHYFDEHEPRCRLCKEREAKFRT